MGFDSLKKPSSFSGDLPLVTMAAITLAASIEEPPPTARMASLPCASAAAWPCLTTG